MQVDKDLSRIAFQERQLVFERFDEGLAWTIGGQLRTWAVERSAPIVIDIRFFHRELFFTALPGSAPDNVEWARRKINVVRRFHQSSYAVGLGMVAKATNLQERYGLTLQDYAAHGGAFPVTVKGVGVIGAVTVSGLPQREDHSLVVEAMADALGFQKNELALAHPG